MAGKLQCRNLQWWGNAGKGILLTHKGIRLDYLRSMKKLPDMRKQHIYHHKDGSVWAKGDKVGGMCEGYWEWFRKDGSIMRSGHFKKDKQFGEWKTYDKKGKLVKKTNF